MQSRSEWFHNQKLIHKIVEQLKKYHAKNIVVDPDDGFLQVVHVY